MSLVMYSRHFDYAEGLCAYTAIKAGGFTPIMGNFEHCTIAIAHMEAFGGLQILLPEEEVGQANEWVSFIYANPIQDYDPIKRRRFGKWKRGTVMMLSAGWFLPLLFLPPLIYFVLVFLSFSVEAYLKIIHIGSYSAFFYALILLHAKYVAGPKFVKQENAHVA